MNELLRNKLSGDELSQDEQSEMAKKIGKKTKRKQDKTQTNRFQCFRQHFNDRQAEAQLLLLHVEHALHIGYVLLRRANCAEKAKIIL
jgi:hypothetical protein